MEINIERPNKEIYIREKIKFAHGLLVDYFFERDTSRYLLLSDWEKSSELCNLGWLAMSHVNLSGHMKDKKGKSKVICFPFFLLLLKFRTGVGFDGEPKGK